MVNHCVVWGCNFKYTSRGSYKARNVSLHSASCVHIIYIPSKLCEMDEEVEIKEEPVWFEGTANISVDTYVSDAVCNDTFVKVESQTSCIPEEENPDLDPGTEDVMTVPAADVKNEIFIEESSIDQLAPRKEEENNLENVAELTSAPVYSCDSCSKSFKTKGTLKYHLQTHTKKRPYSCTTCKKAFLVRSCLKRHMLTHTGDRSHLCTICSRTFVLRSHLKTHVLTHSRNKPHCCTICSRSFAQPVHLRNHLKTHSGERPFSCRLCNSAFSTKCSLKTHMLTHSEQRPHLCSICNKTFVRKGDLRTHLKIHSDERPFLCSTCGRTFRLSFVLKKHQKTHYLEK